MLFLEKVLLTLFNIINCKKMVLKTFNLDESTYREFSTYCKKHGMSMSRKIENFIREELKRLKISTSQGKSDIVARKILHEEIEHSLKKYC